MKVKLSVLVNAEGALKRLCAQPVQVKLAYRLARLTKLVAAETADYHAQRSAVIQEMGTERPVTEEDKAQGFSGSVFEVTKKNLPAFAQKMRELGEVEVTLTDWLLSVELLADIKLSGEDMLALGPLVEDDATPQRAPAPSKAVQKKRS